MTVRFSSVFKKDLLDAETCYAAVSSKLGDDFHARVREAIRTIIVRNGGDHFGPHGFRCRKCRPFPYLVYYDLEGEDLVSFRSGSIRTTSRASFENQERNRANQSPQRNAGAEPAISDEASAPHGAASSEKTAGAQPPRG